MQERDDVVGESVVGDDAPADDEGVEREGRGLSRRRFVGVAGGATLAGVAGAATLREGDTGGTDGAGTDGEQRNTVVEPNDGAALAAGGDGVVFGGRRVVDGADGEGYDTIAAAVAAAADGDVVSVHATYDAAAAGESFPVVVDLAERAVALVGGHPAGSVVDARDAGGASGPAVVFDGGGRGALLANLAFVGGGVGFDGARESVVSGVSVVDADGHGFEVGGGEPADGASRRGGVTLRDCVADGCAGDGFRIDSADAALVDCRSHRNAGRGVVLRSVGTRVSGGFVGDNADYGVDVRSAGAAVRGLSVAGNGTTMDRPHELYVGSVPGVSIGNCHFDGSESRTGGGSTTATGYRAVAVDGATGLDVSNCTFRGYDDAFLYLSRSRDADVHRGSHVTDDGTRTLRRAGDVGTRSDGVLLPTDLRSVPGRHYGEVGVHDGGGDRDGGSDRDGGTEMGSTGGSGRAGDVGFGLCLWDGDRWHHLTDGTLL